MADGLDEFPFDWIARDLRGGNCIPFLGAGASSFPRDANAKPPTARALALELAEESRYPPFRMLRAATSSGAAANTFTFGLPLYTVRYGSIRSTSAIGRPSTSESSFT